MVHPVSSMLGEIYTVMCVFTVSDKLVHIVIGCHKRVVGTYIHVYCTRIEG